MTREKFTDLPAVSTAEMTDIICAVQGYVSPTQIGLSVQETLQDVYNLFQSNVILYYAGNPSGNVEGKTYQLCWDTTNQIMYVCVFTGSTVTAQWNKVITLTGGDNVTISQSGDNIVINADEQSVVWEKVTSNITMVADRGYQINTGSDVELTLPVASIFGEEIHIAGFAGGLFTIKQSAGQAIIVGSVVSTTGVAGSVSATNRYDSVVLVCATDTLVWQVLGAPQGNLSII